MLQQQMHFVRIVYLHISAVTPASFKRSGFARFPAAGGRTQRRYSAQPIWHGIPTVNSEATDLQCRTVATHARGWKDWLNILTKLDLGGKSGSPAILQIADSRRQQIV